MKNSKKHKATIAVLLILLCLSIVAAIYFATKQQDSAIVVETNQELANPDDTGKIRVKMDTYINIEKDTLQNLNFHNLNKDRLLKLKINVNDKAVYESGYVKEGEVLQADIIDSTKLKSGEIKALAEIYSYTTKEEFIGQRNVEIILNNKLGRKK